MLQINELENIQLNKNLQVKSEIIYYIDYRIEDLNINNIVAKIDIYKLAKDEDQK